MKNLTKTKYHSFKKGELCKGCKKCVKGEKLVLFITGLCSQKCFFCPVSEKKFGKDTAYANEYRIKNPSFPKELFEEVRLTSAKGAGITGGDPLCNLKRTLEYIRKLKQEYGKGFHVHLYTTLALVTRSVLKKLFDSGLDEIRFHPDLNKKSDWKKIELSNKFDWDVGVEIPLIPTMKTKTRELLDFLNKKIKFLNLNELELSDTGISHYRLSQMNFVPKDSISYAVKGSIEFGKELMDYAKKYSYSIHLCTAKLKDSVQVKQRILRRAKNIALSTDKTTKDGLLLRGCIYLVELSPKEIGYRKKLSELSAKDRADILKKVKGISNKLKFQNFVDSKKLRILASIESVKSNKRLLKQMILVPAVVEEYPTDDVLETEIEFL